MSERPHRDRDPSGEPSDALTVRLVDSILRRASELSSVSALAFPRPPAEAGTVNSDEGDAGTDLEKLVRDAVEEQERAEAGEPPREGEGDPRKGPHPAAKRTRVYHLTGDAWTAVMELPANMEGAVLRRLRAMAGLDHWKKQPVEGEIRVRSGSGLTIFRLSSDPAGDWIRLDIAGRR